MRFLAVLVLVTCLMSLAAAICTCTYKANEVTCLVCNNAELKVIRRPPCYNFISPCDERFFPCTTGYQCIVGCNCTAICIKDNECF